MFKNKIAFSRKPSSKILSLSLASFSTACSLTISEPLYVTEECDKKDPYRCNFVTSSPCGREIIKDNKIISSFDLFPPPPPIEAIEIVDKFNSYETDYIKGMKYFSYDDAGSQTINAFDITIELGTSWLVPNKGRNWIFRLDSVESSRSYSASLFKCPGELIPSDTETISSSYEKLVFFDDKHNLFPLNQGQNLQINSAAVTYAVFSEGRVDFSIPLTNQKFVLESGDSEPIKGTNVVLTLLGVDFYNDKFNGEYLNGFFIKLKYKTGNKFF